MKTSNKEFCLYKFLKEEKAAAAIVEYSIILPICLFLFGFLFLSGYYLNQRAVLDSAVNRGVVLAQKIYCDPNADAILDMGLSDNYYRSGYRLISGGFSADTNFKSDPYRYLGSNYKYNEIATIIERKVRGSVKTSQLITLESRVSDLNVDLPKSFSGFISYKVTVSASQNFYNPFLPRLVKKNAKPLLTLESSATAAVMNSSEFVRNVNMVDDVIEKFTGSNIGSKLHDMVSKISTFISKTSS